MSDPRFARLKSDPRFRRPKKHNSKVVLDERFKSVFESEKSSKGKKRKSDRVDKYGRPLSETHDQDNLRRFYRLENEEVPEVQSKVPDYARGEVLLESSDEEEEDEKLQDDDSDADKFVTVGRDASRPIRVASDDEAEIDLDESRFADLDAEAAAYNQSHPESQGEQVERTHRLAIVNLDWDHVRAIHLYKICSSLVSPTAPAGGSSSKATAATDRIRNTRGGASNVARGRVVSIRIYPSEFGKERIAREEKEGPPSEVFKKRELEEEEINEHNIIQVGDADEFDEDALRKYQLERLRYYYAIVTCDTIDAASHIYDELEGTELERSANVFDLSFVPDSMSFDDQYRDEATEEDANVAYKGVEFVTDALRHSKVKLTWDEDDPERNQVTRRPITRKELEEADFRAYLASSSSESESDNEEKSNRKVASRDKLRSLLLGGDVELPEGWDQRRDGHDDVDMEVTFMPGLSESKGDQDQTSIDIYRQKMKEKRKKRKEELKKTTKERDNDAVHEEDDFFDASSEDAKSSKKGSKHRKDKSASISSNAPTAEELSLLVSSNDTEPQHFNLKSVLKAERKKKGRRRKGKEDDGEVQEDFKIDVHDDRFKALHEDHNFAIDPSNPHFKKTKAMQALLQQRSQRTDSRDESKEEGKGEGDLRSLVENVKRKSTSMDQTSGKRRKFR